MAKKIAIILSALIMILSFTVQGLASENITITYPQPETTIYVLVVFYQNETYSCFFISSIFNFS